MSLLDGGELEHIWCIYHIMKKQKAINDFLWKFGSAIKTERRRRAWSQEELAHRSGLHRTYITDVERGVRNMTVETITKLSNALGVSMTELISKAERDGRAENEAEGERSGDQKQ